MAEGSIRNMIGCNMSFRSSVFEEVGVFNPDIGRLGSQPLGCEETEICIRALERWPGKKIMYAPGALVNHHASPVQADRPLFRQAVLFLRALSRWSCGDCGEAASDERGG